MRHSGVQEAVGNSYAYELFGNRGLSYIHVPYKGTSEQMVAVAAGQVMMGLNRNRNRNRNSNSNGFARFVDACTQRLLVSFGEQRTQRRPKVPTLKELGHNIAAMSPYGLPGPAGRPADVVQVLHHAFRAAMQDPAFVVELALYDQEPACPPPEDYGRALRAAYEHEQVVVERLGPAQKGERRLPLPAWAAGSRRVATRRRIRRLGWVSAFFGAAG